MRSFLESSLCNESMTYKTKVKLRSRVMVLLNVYKIQLQLSSRNSFIHCYNYVVK